MRKLLYILLFIPFVSFGQQTVFPAVPPTSTTYTPTNRLIAGDTITTKLYMGVNGTFYQVPTFRQMLNALAGGAAIWGNITGTLSLQTDLQTALNGKQNTITLGTTSQYFRGDLSLATFPTALPPNGSAGGDLTGTYPNPTINTINSITKSYYDPTSSIQTQLNGKQPTLVSGTNIKTINSTSVLGSGNISTPNLYNIDGSLTGTRTVTLGANNLNLSASSGIVNITDGTDALTLSPTQFEVSVPAVNTDVSIGPNGPGWLGTITSYIWGKNTDLIITSDANVDLFTQNSVVVHDSGPGSIPLIDDNNHYYVRVSAPNSSCTNCNLSFTDGVMTYTNGSGGSGTVSAVSVVSANGFAGTVATATTTPAITLTTSVTGLLKGNGTAISAAAAGTDYQAALSGTGNVFSTAGTISYRTAVKNEVPTGAINSVNTTFTTANASIAGTIELFYNGMLLRPTTDYTVSGTTITTTFAPASGGLSTNYSY